MLSHGSRRKDAYCFLIALGSMPYCLMRRYRVARLRPRRSAAACTSPRQMVRAATMAPYPESPFDRGEVTGDSDCSSENARSSAESTEDLLV